MIEDEGAVHITKAVGAIYAELYNWTLEAKAGDISVIETEDTIYVIRADEMANFDTLKNSDTMLEWTRFFAVNEQTVQLMNSKKYQVTIHTEVYTEIDLSSIVEAAAKQWN